MRTALVAAVAIALIAVVAAVWRHGDGDGSALLRAVVEPANQAEAQLVAPKPGPTFPSTTATAPPTTVPPTTAPPAPTTTAAPPPRFSFDPYAGLGAWVDTYDWSVTYAGPRGGPFVGAADIERMAGLGVRTLYIQASKHDSPTPVLEPELLIPLIDRAHAVGMRVVAWYLPGLYDHGSDLQRLLAIAELPIDGLGVDIEPLSHQYIAGIPFEELTARLLWLSTELRNALPGQVLSAIPVPPVVFEINPNYWPGYPWAELGALYDVWQPMGYWTMRTASSGWRDGYTYTAANIDRIRQLIGRSDAVVHPIGGVGDQQSAEEMAAHVAGMVQASAERGAIGGSIYDYATTADPV
ncbi:MAG: hypothetical protein ACRD0G_10450, partial [Acidimicrobiales bacterium]